MLKTRRDDNKVWLITQPDHAEVSGYFAAHWGNGEFTRPGYYADSKDPERLRAETVLAIAEHDNGWWEWEATPDLSEEDGLPLGLFGLSETLSEGMDRWRRGVPRFGDRHPYVGLLIGYHAYWLYYRGIDSETDPAFAHQLFSKNAPQRLTGDLLEETLRFIGEIEAMQNGFKTRLLDMPETAEWVKPEHLKPHIRLLQVLDGLSLSICSALICPTKGQARGFGEDEIELPDVPRKSWEDRVTLELRPAGKRRIVCQPYPFDIDPLPVTVSARILDCSEEQTSHFQSRWHSTPRQQIQFEYCSKD